MLQDGGYIKRITNTVLSHVEVQYEADYGKVLTELEQIKETNGNGKEEHSKDEKKESSQPPAVYVRRRHGARVRGLRSSNEVR